MCLLELNSMSCLMYLHDMESWSWVILFVFFIFLLQQGWNAPIFLLLIQYTRIKYKHQKIKDRAKKKLSISCHINYEWAANVFVFAKHKKDGQRLRIILCLLRIRQLEDAVLLTRCRRAWGVKLLIISLVWEWSVPTLLLTPLCCYCCCSFSCHTVKPHSLEGMISHVSQSLKRS